MLRKGIVEAADEHNATLIVLGPHRRNGLLGRLQGSVIIPQHSDSR
jgi:nucleotide-binding universal stress UspA family protein